MNDKDLLRVFLLGIWILLGFFLYKMFQKPIRNITYKSEKIESKIVSPKIKCDHCNGTGESLEDINKLMADAGFVLWMNGHLMIDKCKKCVIEKDKEIYCEEAQNQLDKITKEYQDIGPDMQIDQCPKCMGSGLVVKN